MDGRNYILGVFGRKNSGKSTFVSERAAGIPRLGVIDTLGEYSQIFPPCPGALPEQVLMLSQNQAPMQYSYLLPPQHFATAFNYLCKAAYMGGNLTLVIEEIDYFSKPNWNEEGLDLLIRYGRHRNVNVIYTVRNLGETSRRLTSQTDYYVAFRVTEPLYLDAIAERLSDDAALRIANLGEHEHIIVEVATKRIL